MNMKTIAVAALALVATTGLASARTVHKQEPAAAAPAPYSPYKYPGDNAMGNGIAPKVFASADPAKASPPMDPSEAAFETNPFQAPYGQAGGLNDVTSFNHPGDNDMDPYLDR